MFSDEDIKTAMEKWSSNPLEEGLFIEPFDKKYLTPVGYDLRVGKEVFSWNKKRVIEIEKDGSIQIEPNDTIVIKTLEDISLSKKVSATIHAMVSKIITKGFSDISTTVDPGWSGKLLISIHNHRDSYTELRFAEPFCTICFYSVGIAAKTNLGRPIDRDDLWDQLLEKAQIEKTRIEAEEKRKKQAIEKSNSDRNILLIFLVLATLSIGITSSVINATVGSSVAAFLAVIAPIVYDKFLKPQSKL
ncbi:deoxycytidine deaminase [Pelatocladus sp. BLCC-F211]|uniref:dCTP deaminase n=1 Tax=Pelatocladus sp. BLCC-F211 TaxID=3342752 RepID=UPI0035B7BBB2